MAGRNLLSRQLEAYPETDSQLGIEMGVLLSHVYREF